MTHTTATAAARAITTGAAHHFFGYYNLTPWDASGRYVLTLEVDFCDHPPRRSDVARIGMVDTAEDNTWRALADTRAWNWQQGCMLQWLPAHADRMIIYNDIVDGRAVAVIRDVFTGETRTLPRPVYALNPDATKALTLNFARVHRLRPGYGYVGAIDHTLAQQCPDDDGIYELDVLTGESQLVVSLNQLAALRPRPTMRHVQHWVNHIQYNTDGTRFAFLHRWETRFGTVGGFLRRVWRKARRTVSSRYRIPRARFTRMLTAAPDGAGLRIVADDDMVSHFDWRDPRFILGWAHVASMGTHYYLFDEHDASATTVAPDLLTRDGHCTYSPDRAWILTDTYPDPLTHNRSLILYHPGSNRRVDIGDFLSPPSFSGEIRCDLHPRWNRDGTKVCFDSVHEGMRQVYVADVGNIAGKGH